MASNSDTLYYVLSKINHHPELIKTRMPLYSNAISITTPDNLKIADSDFYFPDSKLMVNRLAPEFVAKNGELLDYFYQQTRGDIPGYHDVWVTTSHIPRESVYLIELSYE